MKKDAKQAAIEIRRVLKSTYPDCEFSVRIKRFAGGSAVDLTWTDGPTEKEVSKVTSHLKGYDNGYYNEYIGTSRHTSHEVMEAAAKAATEYYEVEMPKIVGGEFPYVDGYEVVTGFSSLDQPEVISDKIHRAVWSTSVYDIDITEAFKEAFPN